jgi:hypothetical protein
MAYRRPLRNPRRARVVAQQWQLAGAESQKKRVAVSVGAAIETLGDKLKEKAIEGPLTIAAFLREAKIDRKTLQRDYHAESYARVLSFVASTSTRAHTTARREPKTTSYYRAMRSYAAAAEGAKLEVTRLTKLLDEARSEISRLTQPRASSSKVNKARKEAA